MNVRRRPRAVLLGRLTTMPFGGVVWQVLHYLLGLERLGFDAWYVEAHAVAPRHFLRGDGDDGAEAAAAFLDGVLRRFGLGRRWAYHALHSDGRCLGLGASRLRELYGSAEVLINLHGGTRPRPEHTAGNRLVCVATDPVQMELELDRGEASTIEFHQAHRAVFTFGENLGAPDCGLPVPARFPLLPTRQPVVLELWEGRGGAREAYTTVANWRQRRPLDYGGQTYAWSKHFEFLKLVDLPSRVAPPLELALARCPEEDRRMLAAHGWRVRDALALSGDLDTYRDYVTGSRGELTVAKDQNIRLRSGWFSDRSATYLASGRPVVTQDTGFGNVLPTGEGLFAFTNADEAAAAIAAIEGDWPRHSRAAAEVARTCFAHDVVLPSLLARAGVDLPPRRRRPGAGAALRVLLVSHRYPPDARGGVEVYTQRLARSLAGAGHPVAVLARRPDGKAPRREMSSDEEGIPVHRLTGTARRERFLLEADEGERLFREALAEADPDVVHVNHVVDLSPRLLLAARERGAAVVLTLHDYWFACQRIVLLQPDGRICAGPRGGAECARACFASDPAARERWRLRTAYFRALLGLAHRVTCPSRHTAGFFARHGVPRERLRAVPNGVWVPRDASAAGWDTPGERGRLALAFLGAVLPHKGLHVVLEALARAGLPAVDLTAFGPVDDGAYARALYARAAEVPGLRFRMFAEYEADDLPVLLDGVDAVVVPSQWRETYCLVARETLARGIPALVADVGALGEAVTPGRNGFRFAHDRPDELAAILRRLAGEPDLLPRLRRGAQRTRLNTFEEHVAAMRAIYREAWREASHAAPAPIERAELTDLERSLAAAGFGSPAQSGSPIEPGSSPTLDGMPALAAGVPLPTTRHHDDPNRTAHLLQLP